MQQTIHTYIV